MPERSRGKKRLPEWARLDFTYLAGAIVSFALAWLSLATRNWQRGMTLIAFGLVMIVLAVATFRNRNRDPEES